MKKFFKKTPYVLLLLNNFFTSIPKTVLKNKNIPFFPINKYLLIDYILRHLYENKLYKVLIVGNHDECYSYIKYFYPSIKILYWKIENINNIGDIFRECARRIYNEEELEGSFISINKKFIKQFLNQDNNLTNEHLKNINITSDVKLSENDFKEMVIYNCNTFTTIDLNDLIKTHRIKKDGILTAFLYNRDYTYEKSIRVYGVEDNIIKYYKFYANSAQINKNEILNLLESHKNINISKSFDGINILMVNKLFFWQYKDNFDYIDIEDLILGLNTFNPNDYKCHAYIPSNQQMGYKEEFKMLSYSKDNISSVCSIINNKKFCNNYSFLEDIVGKNSINISKNILHFKINEEASSDNLHGIINIQQPTGFTEEQQKIINDQSSHLNITYKSGEQPNSTVQLHQTSIFLPPEKGGYFYSKTIFSLKDYYEFTVDVRFMNINIECSRIERAVIHDDGIVVTNCIISSNCEIKNNIKECIIWNDVVVNEPLDFCLVLKDSKPIHFSAEEDVEVKKENTFKKTGTFKNDCFKLLVNSYEGGKNKRTTYREAIMLKIVYNSSVDELITVFISFLANLFDCENISHSMDEIYNWLPFLLRIIDSVNKNDIQKAEILIVETFFNHLDSPVEYKYHATKEFTKRCINMDILNKDVVRGLLKQYKSNIKKMFKGIEN